MIGSEVKNLRKDDLSLSRVQFAHLLGVHPLTVYKWERGKSPPTPHQQALLESFKKATRSQPDIGKAVATALVTAGVALALFLLLNAAFGENRR